MDQRILGGTVGRIEGEVDLVRLRSDLPGAGHFSSGDTKVGTREAGSASIRRAMAPAFVERHAQQVLLRSPCAYRGAGPDARSQKEIISSRDGADFIADHGEGETGQGHAANLLWTGRFG